MSKIKKCTGKESFQRMNYLYQISNDFTSIDPNKSIISKIYTNLLVNISKKSVQRMEVDMKRTICKRCRTILLSGVTCKVRIRRKKIKWVCLTCNKVKIFNASHRATDLWSKQKESIVEILDYSLDVQQKNENVDLDNEKVTIKSSDHSLYLQKNDNKIPT